MDIAATKGIMAAGALCFCRERGEGVEEEWRPWQMGEERSCCCCCFGRAETTGKRGRDLGNREEVWLASSGFHVN